MNAPGPLPISLGSLFGRFLRFGLLAFGGPVAQIAMIRRDLVETERWISDAHFNRLLAVMQVLPGPEAHELCVHLGIRARGRVGGLLAGLGFMLPGFLLMLAAAWLYVRFGDQWDILSGVFLGVQVAALAIIVCAVLRIGMHVLEDRWLWLIAIGAGLGTLVGAPFWLTLIAAGCGHLCLASGRRGWAAVVALTAIIVFILTLGLSGVETRSDGAIASATALALFWAGLKAGLLTFGGAYTAIPYVRADTVPKGWISDGAFLEGVALAGLLPTPLVIFATFVGYVAAGLWGALAITAGIFLPAFAFSMLFYERLERIVENPALHSVLVGVAAAVVGIIAATSLQLIASTLPNVPDLRIGAALLAGATILAWRIRHRLVPLGLIALGGAVGAVAF